MQGRAAAPNEAQRLLVRGVVEAVQRAVVEAEAVVPDVDRAVLGLRVRAGQARLGVGVPDDAALDALAAEGLARAPASSGRLRGVVVLGTTGLCLPWVTVSMANRKRACVRLSLLLGLREDILDDATRALSPLTTLRRVLHRQPALLTTGKQVAAVPPVLFIVIFVIVVPVRMPRAQGRKRSDAPPRLAPTLRGLLRPSGGLLRSGPSVERSGSGVVIRYVCRRAGLITTFGSGISLGE